MDNLHVRQDESLEGELVRIVYQSDEDSYTVARFKPVGRFDEITITGNLAGALPGEVLKVSGRWITHKKFGLQFSINSFTSVVPSSVKGIERYLSSGLVKGVGPVMSKRLVSMFGTETLDVIESMPERLAEVEGIGPKRTDMIIRAWETQKELKQIMLFLQSHDVGTAMAVKIYKRYGQSAISVLKENPYRLAAEIFGIGFKTADKIALKLGVSTDSVMRARAGILYILNDMADKGHCFLPVPLLIQECENILNIAEARVREALLELEQEKRIIVEDSLFKDVSKKEGVKCIYLTSLYVAETGITRLIKGLKDHPRAIRHVNVDKALCWVEKLMLMDLDPIQKEAIAKSLLNKVMVITGGPGTGKTTIIRAILKIFYELKIKITLAAPTGRAAKRMYEATGKQAKTIHRLLEFSPQIGKFVKNEQNPLKADLIILDEVSMIDTMLMYNLLKAIKLQAFLILVGDANQLPSVGPGNVLEDICNSGVVEVVRLQKIFRQAQRSLIVSNAHKILNGEFPVIPQKGQNADFFFVEEEHPDKILRLIIEMYKVHIPNRFGFDPNKDIQVITPMNKGSVGTISLNQELQRHLNPISSGMHRGGRFFKLHDKVMQIRNNYDKEVFNGDIGSIIHLDEDALDAVVEFDNRKVSYDISDMDELVLAYAISVHKSQGSEYPVIIMPITTQHYTLLQRNLIYTGLTRAKRLMVMIGTKKALAIAIGNAKVEKRYTLLAERLKMEENRSISKTGHQ